MPFYFQAVQDVSATASGVRLIAMVLPEILAVMIAGALVTVVGYYVSFPAAICAWFRLGFN